MASLASPMRVLVLAAAVNPEKGSEPGMGWRWVSELSRQAEIHLICFDDESNAIAIDRAISANPSLATNLHVHYVAWNWSQRPPWLHWLARNVPYVYYVYYREWHKRAFKKAQELHQSHPFDLAHQLNMIGFREPGFLGRLGIPWVWGPVGGAANPPLRLATRLGVQEFAFLAVKSAANRIQLHLSRRVRTAALTCTRLISATSDTREVLLQAFGRDSRVISAVGCSMPSSPPRRERGNPELHIVWSGLHIARKALPLLLEAAGRLPPHLQWSLTILGSGPLTAKWKRIADERGIAHRCTWTGWLEKDAAIRRMHAADLFVLTSLHEGSPTVVFEALQCGIPVVALRRFGMADAITPACGYLISPDSWETAVEAMSSALREVIEDPSKLATLSQGALLRAEELRWEVLCAAMEEEYRAALSPRFAVPLGNHLGLGSK